MDQLAIWGESRHAQIARIDFGDVPARSSSDLQIRVRNLSRQYTAQTCTLTVEDSVPTATPGADTQFLLSLDGRTFTGSVTLGDLAPAAISPTIWIRRVTASSVPAADYTCQLRAHAGAWV